MYQGNLGGVTPQHIISVEDKSEDEVRALLDLKSSIVCVDKIKAAVISIQTPGKSREKLHSSVLSSCCSWSINHWTLTIKWWVQSWSCARKSVWLTLYLLQLMVLVVTIHGSASKPVSFWCVFNDYWDSLIPIIMQRTYVTSCGAAHHLCGWVTTQWI